MALAAAKDPTNTIADKASATPLHAANLVPDTVEAIDRSLAAAKARLTEVNAAREACRARRKQFAQNSDRQSYLKERQAEAELDFEVESEEAKISSLNAARPAIMAREAAQKLRDERTALDGRRKEFEKVALKKLEAAISVCCEFLPIEEALFREIAEFNRRAGAAGLDPIASPEASRHRPGEPEHQSGTRDVQRNRLRPGAETSTLTGSDRYETYRAIEPVIVPAVPEFKPSPLFERVIVPSFHRDGPRYAPPGVRLPW